MPSLRKRLFSRRKKQSSSESVGPPETPPAAVCEPPVTSLTNGSRSSPPLTPGSHEVKAYAGPPPEPAQETKVPDMPETVQESPFVEAEPVMEDVPKAKAVAGEDVQEPAQYYVHAEKLLYAVTALGIVLCMLTIKLLKPGFWELSTFVGAGFLGGVYVTYGYLGNTSKKQAVGEMLRLNPGVKGLAALMGDPPTWLSYREKDKVEWLNKMLSQMWPFYDKAICDTIKDVVEPVMEDVRPPIFKFIGFKKLTFGDVPFRVEGVHVEEAADEVIMDVDLRWCGDSNITLSIEPNLPGDVTRMAPTINQISVVGTVRIIFKPFLPTPPCFGAIVVSLVKPPMMKFKIDVGKALGGNVVGNTVKKALYPFINDTLVNMLVWPQRYVVPLMYEEDTGPLDHLELRSVGLLVVRIMEARNLPAADMGGSSDPVVEIFTEVKRKFKSKVIKQNLNPKWDEDPKYLFVQEPRSQFFRVNVYDVDTFNARNLVKGFNVIKGIKESIGAEELLGRAQVPIQTVSRHAGTVVDEWYDLGLGDWAGDMGPGSGRGQIRLRMVYQPFSSLNPSDSAFGAVIVKIIRCRNLVAKDASGTSDPYIKLKLKSEGHQTHVMKQNLNPEFHLTFEWWEVSANDELKIKVYDKDYGPQSDDFMGEVSMPVSDIAKSKDSQGHKGIMKGWFKLKDVDHGEMEMNIQFIPFPDMRNVV